ncbi:MAG: rhodanese-like domain-containing protein [Candidatus Dadabacteria bacterium]|nr:MAG: rhodanese-like domain-containing protein [Candidatus Dadabacteria bacterium]
MKRLPLRRVAAAAAAVLGLAAGSWAVGPSELKAALDAGERITVVDIRPNKEFRQAHIPGALNLPAPVLSKRRIPPFGRVVVCGDGIRPDLTEEAAAELNRHAGVQAETLEGGFAAWEAIGFPTTRPPGAGHAEVRQLSYQELQRIVAAGTEVMLVDLRAGGKGLGSGWDLGEAFPGARVAQGKPRGAPDPAVLYVLVDDGDGSADAAALRLRAAGYRRVAVLAGGQRTVEREGRSAIETRTLYMKVKP